VTLTVNLEPEVEAALLAQARAKGVPLGVYVGELLGQKASGPSTPKLNATEWEQALDEWVEGSGEVPHLPDEALRREFLYHRD
jgi:hypothetical protein